MNTHSTISTFATALLMVGLLAGCEDEPASGEAQQVLHSSPASEASAVQEEQPSQPPPPAFRGPPGHHHRGPRMLVFAMLRHADEIGLSQQQQDELATLVEKGRQDAPSDREGRLAMKDQMHEMMKADPLDVEALTASHEKIQSLRRDRQKQRLSVTLDALESLTADQRSALFDIIEKRMGKGPGFGHQKAKDGSGEGKLGPMKHKFGHKKHRGPDGPHGLVFAMKARADDLGLSDEQTSSLESILDKGREDGLQSRDRMHDLFSSMHELFRAETLDREAIESRQEEIMDLMDEMGDLRFQVMVDALEVLTAGQRAELFEILPGPRGPMGDADCPMKHKSMKHKGLGKKGWNKPAGALDAPPAPPEQMPW